MKRLILEATGEFFAWVASDFSLMPTYVSAQLEELTRHSDVDLVYPGVLLSGSNGKYPQFDKFSLQDENPVKRFQTLFQELELGTAVYGLYRIELLKSLFLCPPTGFLPLWTSSRFFHFGDLQFLSFVVLKTPVRQVNELLIERDRTRDSRPYPDELARLERYFQHRRTNVGLPCFFGLNEILIRLFQTDLPFQTVLQLSAFVVQTLFSRFASLFDYELNAICEIISNEQYARAWDASYTEQNLAEIPNGQFNSAEFLRYIYDDLHIASLYSEDERITLALKICADRIGIKLN